MALDMRRQIDDWNALLEDKSLGKVPLPDLDTFALMAGFLQNVIAEGDEQKVRIFNELMAHRGSVGTTAITMLLSWAWMLGRLEERRERRGK